MATVGCVGTWEKPDGQGMPSPSQFKAKGFWNCGDCFMPNSRGSQGYFILPGRRNILNVPGRQAPCPTCLEFFIPQDIAASRESYLGHSELRVVAQGPEVEPIRNSPMSSMLPRPTLGMNSPILSCSILDKVSRTSLTPPPPGTSKTVTGLLPGNLLMLHAWSRAGRDLTNHVVRFDVLPEGLQFRACDLPTSC